MVISLGANIPDPFPARFFPTRSRGLYKDGLIEPRDGVRTKSSPMYITRPKSYP